MIGVSSRQRPSLGRVAVTLAEGEGVARARQGRANEVRVTPEQLVRAEILALKAYHVAPAEGMVKLDAMENPTPFPAVRRELAEALARVDLNRYPDPAAPKLRELIARKMVFLPGWSCCSATARTISFRW